ncbi:hypothetical protein ACWCPT_05805 [Streptomyces sp. NPDC002308]
MNPPAWPYTQPARELLERALRLLDDPTDQNLREARRLTRRAADLVPQLGQDVNCNTYRRGDGPNAVCLSESCGRCVPIRLARAAEQDADDEALDRLADGAERDVQAIMEASGYVRHGGITSRGLSWSSCTSCLKAPCGGIVIGTEREDCPEHGDAAQTQYLHWAAECPAASAFPQ